MGAGGLSVRVSTCVFAVEEPVKTKMIKADATTLDILQNSKAIDRPASIIEGNEYRS